MLLYHILQYERTVHVDVQ